MIQSLSGAIGVTEAAFLGAFTTCDDCKNVIVRNAATEFRHRCTGRREPCPRLADASPFISPKKEYVGMPRGDFELWATRCGDCKLVFLQSAFEDHLCAGRTVMDRVNGFDKSSPGYRFPLQYGRD